jgi:hypothetical protein
MICVDDGDYDDDSDCGRHCGGDGGGANYKYPH